METQSTAPGTNYRLHALEDFTSVFPRYFLDEFRQRLLESNCRIFQNEYNSVNEKDPLKMPLRDMARISEICYLKKPLKRYCRLHRTQHVGMDFNEEQRGSNLLLLYVWQLPADFPRLANPSYGILAHHSKVNGRRLRKRVL